MEKHNEEMKTQGGMGEFARQSTLNAIKDKENVTILDPKMDILSESTELKEYEKVVVDPISEYKKIADGLNLNKDAEKIDPFEVEGIYLGWDRQKEVVLSKFDPKEKPNYILIGTPGHGAAFKVPKGSER